MATRELPDKESRDISSSSSAALDDFYNRPHITTQQVPFLVVGGSDGSGTRMFVSLLEQQLGVPMIIDNYDTMDVHGEEMTFQYDPRFSAISKMKDSEPVHGWPPVVQSILQETPNSLNYTMQMLHKSTQQQVTKALLQLKSSLIQKGVKLEQQRHNNYNYNYNRIAPAALVQYGFKAPITMTLVPALQQVLGRIKFLHVIRDGRDVALSENQSPVYKFYDFFYNHSHPGGLARDGKKQHAAMQLWNDWNSQLYHWARQRVTQVVGDDDNNNNHQQTFDYMVIRTEDLLDDDTRFEALVQIAEFVGAKVTPNMLCCLSRSRGFIHDLGQSGQSGGGDNNINNNVMRGNLQQQEQAIKSRYGKWKQSLQNQPELLTMLQDTGAPALKLFGYEPSQRFLDQSQIVQDFQCNDKKMDCDEF